MRRKKIIEIRPLLLIYSALSLKVCSKPLRLPNNEMTDLTMQGLSSESRGKQSQRTLLKAL
jgi:hypothetical protein